MKHPSTNIQAPEKPQAPSSKQLRRSNADWYLVLGASLDVGAWNLELIYG
ncbi:MAG TPA: hypothetical protein PKA41_08200 [Verrucomicrobiota bacterium]|nr:hypothetical protein [Verrucomicrobiota bacterium]